MFMIQPEKFGTSILLIFPRFDIYSYQDFLQAGIEMSNWTILDINLERKEYKY